jgi:hypothetical protein
VGRFCEHRREILRATWFDANTNANCDSDAYSHSDADRYSDAYTDCDAHAYGDADAVHRQMYTYAKAAPHSCASPIALI